MEKDGYLIRLAEAADYRFLPAIELAAGKAFDHCGLPPFDDDEISVLPEAFYHSLPETARVFVAESASGKLVGFVVLTTVDGQGYVKELDVDTGFQKKGIGRALMEALVAEARRLGYSFLSLTTFVDIPFNAPFYEKMGFAIIPQKDIEPELAAIRSTEEKNGLDDWSPRCAMGMPL